MNRLFSKKKFFLFALASFILLNTTCKKSVVKYPFDMAGIWYADDIFCPQIFVIEKNGEGKMFASSSLFCTGGGLNLKGKIKYKNDIMYLDGKKFSIFSEPTKVTATETIEAPDDKNLTGDNYKTYDVIAKMTLIEKGIFTFETTYNFSKIVDY
jgi:hypothetical protein